MDGGRRGTHDRERRAGGERMRQNGLTDGERDGPRI